MANTVEIAVKPKVSAKGEMRALLERLPDSVTLGDIAYRPDVVIKVPEAEASDPRDDISDEEFFRELEEEWRAR